MKSRIIFLVIISPYLLFSQNGIWQQTVDYTIKIDIDDNENQAFGKEKLIYTNNSTDSLKELYFHLYWNVFQKGSHYFEKKGNFLYESLSEENFGGIEISSLLVDGVETPMKVFESIGQVKLMQFIAPGKQVEIEINFTSKLPSCIDRAGKNNSAGTDFTFTQWYPKICRYDHMGWHTDPYLGREFAGVFGVYEVEINCDSRFVVAGTGNLQNKQYTTNGWSPIEGIENVTSKTKWVFRAENVHDFAFAMDKEWKHEQLKIDDIVFHFFYGEDYTDDWEVLIKNWPKSYAICKREFGIYPYKQFSFIQAGEGYMEYPNCTMLESSRSDFYNTACHEFMHNYFYGIFGTDENLYHWMDEGLTCYAEARISDLENDVFNYAQDASKTYLGYASWVQEEPMSTAANHFTGDYPYYIGAYFKGQTFPELIRYMVGDNKMQEGFKRYYAKWKFKHPEPNDFVKIFEDITLMELSWFENYWLHTTQSIDFAIDTVVQKNEDIEIRVSKNGIPMPLEIALEYKSGRIEYFYIPLDLTNNVKTDFYRATKVLDKWSSASSDYTFLLQGKRLKDVVKVSLDPDRFLPDVNTKNNEWRFRK